MGSEIFLLRHGETEWNAAGRFQGRLDSPLTQRGRDQAAEVGRTLAAVLAGRSTPPLHVSPLGRAQETASIVACQIPGLHSSRVEPRLQEVTTGSWDGLTHTDIEAGWPNALDGATEFDWYFRSPDGEDYPAAVGRVRTWLDGLDGSVIAVSHGLLGRLVRGVWLGLPREEALLLPVPQDVVWHLSASGVRPLASGLGL